MATNTVTFDRAAMEQLDSMFSKHTNELKTLARSMQQRTGGGVLGGMGNGGMKNGLPDAQAELEKFIKILSLNNKALSQTEKYNLGAARRELEATKKSIAATEEERKRREALGEIIEENADAQEDQTDKIKKSSGRLADFAEKVVGGTMSFTVLTRAINEFSQAYKQGFNWNAMSDTVNAALQMGMSPKDMMDFQKRFRTVSNTFEGGISDFNDTIAGSNREWLHFTGSLKDAAVAQGEFYQLAMSMGVGAQDIKGAVGGMFQEFKKLQVATSMTAEEFVATQKSLLAEQVVRSKLVGLQGKERSNYMLKLTDTAYMFQTLGLQKEAAESLVKALEAQSGKTGVNRLVEGAQMSAVTGMLGMRGDGARLRELSVKKNRTTDENAQLTALAAEFEKRVQGEINAGGTREMRMNALQAQMPQMFETISKLGQDPALAANIANPAAIEKQRLAIAERDSGVYGEIKENIVLIADILGGWSQSALAALVAFGVGKGALAGGRAWMGRRQGAGGARNPDFIGPPRPDPGPGLRSRALGGAATMAKTGMFAAVAGVAASAAVNAYVKDEGSKDTLNSAITGASIGATIGSVVPVIGTIGGAAIGGIIGGMVGIINNQDTMDSNLEKQKKQIVEQTSLDQRRFEQAQRAYKTEIDQLTQKGKLNAEEQARVDALKAAMEKSKSDHSASQAKLAGAQTGYQLGKQADAKDWMSQAARSIKGGSWWGGDTSAEDTNSVMSQMAAKLNAAGLTLSETEIRAQVGDIIGSMATQSGISANERDKLFDAAGSIKEGSGSYDTSVNPQIATAIQKYMETQVTAGFANSNQATFATKFNTPEAIAGLAEQVKTAADQLAKDKSDLAATQSMYDESGASTFEAVKIQKRIDNSQATLDALQQLASKDNTVKFQSEEALLKVLGDLASAMKGGNPPPPIHQ